jgi:hypothetical protein
MKRSDLNKRAQMRLSFGMIFSIFLIIVFIAFAIYGIMKFLEWQKTVQIGQFYNNLQSDVDKLWKGTQGAVEKTYVIPSKVEKVCFIDIDSIKKGGNINIYDDLSLFGFNRNLVLYPISFGELTATNIEHINMSETLNENPLCIENSDGKVKISMRMNPGDSLVTIEPF